MQHVCAGNGESQIPFFFFFLLTCPSAYYTRIMVVVDMNIGLYQCISVCVYIYDIYEICGCVHICMQRDRGHSFYSLGL